MIFVPYIVKIRQQLIMKKVKGRNLGESLLLDGSTQVWTEETTETPAVVSTEQLLKSVVVFKEFTNSGVKED